MRSTELFQRITRQIADAIEAGAGEFRMPWHRWGETLASPINVTSGKPYRGINTLLLWAAAEADGYSSGRWATYRQWSTTGAQVRKGEKSTAILFWKSSSERRPQDEEVNTDSRAPRFLARVYNVFNADQVDGERPRGINGPQSHDRVTLAERFFKATRSDVRLGGDKACYVPSLDQIWLPRFEQFRDALSFYSTLAHETVHWSGAKHRLNRDLAGRFGTDSYGMEELIAELGAAFIAAYLGLSVVPRPDHAAYINTWLRVLRGDPRAILSAVAKAQEAVDYIVRLASAASSRSEAVTESDSERFAA